MYTNAQLLYLWKIMLCILDIIAMIKVLVYRVEMMNLLKISKLIENKQIH